MYWPSKRNTLNTTRALEVIQIDKDWQYAYAKEIRTKKCKKKTGWKTVEKKIRTKYCCHAWTGHNCKGSLWQQSSPINSKNVPFLGYKETLFSPSSCRLSTSPLSDADSKTWKAAQRALESLNFRHYQIQISKLERHRQKALESVNSRHYQKQIALKIVQKIVHSRRYQIQIEQDLKDSDKQLLNYWIFATIRSR